jgi:hypothetical protein
MNRSKGHVPKSSQERAAYVNYIRKLDYEPTKDEALEFSESSDKEADYSIQKSDKVRRLSTWEQFQTHFEENWIKWVIAGIGIVISYFIVSSQISFYGIDIKMEQTGKEIEKINSNIEEIKNTNHEQDMKIQKSEIIIEDIKDENKSNKE